MAAICLCPSGIHFRQIRQELFRADQLKCPLVVSFDEPVDGQLVDERIEGFFIFCVAQFFETRFFFGKAR